MYTKVYFRDAGELGLFAVETDDHVEAIQMAVRHEEHNLQLQGPFLALIEGGKK